MAAGGIVCRLPTNGVSLRFCSRRGIPEKDTKTLDLPHFRFEIVFLYKLKMNLRRF